MKSPKSTKRCYRILKEDDQNDKLNHKALTPQKLAEKIMRSNKYLYIDVNEQSGLKAMERISPDDADVETEKIGVNVISSLNFLSPQNQKTIDYVYKINDFRKQKDNFKFLLKRRLDSILDERDRKQEKKKKQKQKQREKRNKSAMLGNLGSFILDSSLQNTEEEQVDCQYKKKAKLSLNAHDKDGAKKLSSVEKELFKKAYEEKQVVYRGMKTQNLNTIIQKKQLQEINSSIVQREKKLIEKYGMTNEYESIIKQRSPIVRNSRKIFLPEIKSVLKFE